MTTKDTGIKIDRVSFQLGMINCFAEMVACGVKDLAISPPISPEDFAPVKTASDLIVKKFGIESYLEKNLLITSLQAEKFTRDKWSILYFKEKETLDTYLDLKREKQELENAGIYERLAEKELSRRFMKLLSYPDEVIDQKLSREKPDSPFILIDE